MPTITPFIVAGGKELLFLADRPGDAAMKVYGQKWNALGRDEQGRPNGAGPAEYVIAGRAVAVVVNPANKLESLTLEQVQAVFDGEVDSWSTLQAGDGKISAYGLRQGDPAAAVFYKECLPAEKFRKVTTKKDSAEAISAVAADPQGIAFVDLTALPAGPAKAGVKVLAIRIGTGATQRPVAPSADTIRNTSYPLSQRLFLYVHPQASDTAKDFARFIATCGQSEASPYTDTVKAVAETYRKHGLVPLAEIKPANRWPTTMPAAATTRPAAQ